MKNKFSKIQKLLTPWGISNAYNPEESLLTVIADFPNDSIISELLETTGYFDELNKQEIPDF